MKNQQKEKDQSPPHKKEFKKKEGSKKRGFKKKDFKKKSFKRNPLKREFHKGFLASSRRTHNSNTRYRACGI
ncbi:hypothetical protein BTM372_15230 [Helicobacter pylori]